GPELTGPIQARANELLRGDLAGVKRMPYERALRAATTERFDYVTPYVSELDEVVDIQAIVSAGLRLGADPMGGAGVHFWAPIVERYGLSLEVVNPDV